MTPDLQPVQHPDAELLSAFAEQELSAAEQAQILEHLGGCARCREIVFLAQQAAAPFLVNRPAELPAIESQLQNRRRLTLVWSAAAAIAAMLLLTVAIRLAPGRRGDLAARVDQPALSAAPMDEAGATHTSPYAPANPAPRLAARPSETTRAEILTDAMKPAPAARMEKGTAPRAGAAPTPAFSALESMGRAKSLEFEADEPPAHLAERSAAASMAQPVRETQARKSARSSVLYDEALPNGHHLFSKASAGTLAVSIDEDGTVYRTQDAGKNWSPVAVQWSGRAVRVSTLVTQVTTTSAPEGHAPGPEPGGRDLFELVNDKGLTWRSGDGQSWKSFPLNR